MKEHEKRKDEKAETPPGQDLEAKTKESKSLRKEAPVRG
jgi:hypothetical protein